jgi:hypothetical protein
MSRALLCAVAAVLALSGCESGPATETQADAATMAACRHRADEIYDQQNRADIYRPPDQVNSPFSANYTPDVSDRGLSALYAHEKMVSDCVRNTGTGADRSDFNAAGPTPPLRP